MSCNHVVRYIGDDWKGRLAFTFTFQDVNGVAQDITGFTPTGLLYVKGSAVPIPLLAAEGNARLIDATAGMFELSVGKAETTAIIADDFNVSVFPTRVQAQLIDPDGNVGTLDLVLVRCLDPRTATSWATAL